MVTKVQMASSRIEPQNDFPDASVDPTNGTSLRSPI
jgi:hypothetical protein